MKKLNMLKLLAALVVVYLSGCASKKEIYMPISFMDAELLSGGQFSLEKQNPTPVIVKITGPANLPNDFQSSVLVGCNALVEGYADLASERVMLRLNQVFCIDGNGKARIDAPVKGFIQAADGKIGLVGKLVHTENHLPFIEVLPPTKATLVITQGIMLQEK